ncbi:hypothetical protein OHB26_39635 (plasmid) [Nocardia sp. NBC_01503]|uniref:hypothetical protein n=1 Tax=Nocardia sp. NBC_01503 TaxID=2975997 RepID=UPI002E7BF9D1|nr:hypothetical protein [Nocardia sp. NBC_01503]WTL36656.1 hypothetical protein OHB26_38940 [Nocardia sp. NBC_01503]WTL36791.1 hypothetical protein OHB26_39635 [Nocardia sp. NBC_01503]
MTDIDDGNPWSRQGARWTAYHYRTLITGLVQGRPWRDIARSLGRTEKATRDRASMLIENGGRGKACDRLREAIEADPGYDWDTIARGKHAAAELPYWDEEAEELLRTIWEASTPPRNWLRRNRTEPTGMAELVARLPAPEFEICDRLVELGLSRSYAEIADRLGCIPGGALDQRARKARVDAPVAEYILVAADELGNIVHTSLHPHRDDAEHARGIVEAREAQKGPVGSRITRRVNGRIFDTDLDDDSHTHAADRPRRDLDLADADSDVEVPGLVDLDEAMPEPPRPDPVVASRTEIPRMPESLQRRLLGSGDVPPKLPDEV